MTEIEGSKYSRDIKIPIFDKKTSDFCFERSREIFNKPLNFSIDLNTSTLDKRDYDKKTRDLIGENLMDIEKTLNALNLDFLQAFNELEKTDSAETLFGDHFLFENNLKSVQNFNKKNYSNPTDIDNITKGSSNSSSTVTKKSATRDYYSPLEKHSNNSDKSYSPRDSTKTTPNSFSPQESTALSRGFSFNYPSKGRNYFLSPTKRMYSNQQQFLNQLRKYDEAKNNNSGHRQRSMSFTENFEIKSPSVIKAAGFAKMNSIKSIEGKKTGSLDEEYGNRNSLFLPTSNNISQLMTSMTEKPRNVITCKPKSRRARNLRRLSYNPLNMVNSSSSSSESEMEKSMAVSECDIRSKIYSSRFQKRFMNRKSRRIITQDGTAHYYRSENSQYSNSSNPNVNNGIDAKIYGSNTSIKSAPHYNYSIDGPQQFVGDDKTAMSSSDLDSEEELNNTSLVDQQRAKVSPKDTRTLTPTPQQQFSSNFNNIYEFVGKCFNRNFGLSRNGQENVKQQQPQKQINYSNYRRPKISNSNLDLLYTDFDVTKLTGKSPTTQSYFDIIDYDNVSKKSGISTLRPSDFKRGGTFQWPEKIDGSTVKQNDLIWELQKQHESDLKEKEERRKQQRKVMIETLKKSTYTSSSSSTEENNSVNYRRQTNNYLPPSPAP